MKKKRVVKRGKGRGSGRVARDALARGMAIMAVDPGGTTGYFTAMAPVGATMKETAKGVQSPVAGQIAGKYLDQAEALAQVWGSFAMEAERAGIPADRRFVVIEDFVLRRRQEGGATGNLTSVWVAAAFTAKIADEALWQTASGAKTYASDERLKLWGLYGYSLKPAKPHARDAIRHWALRANKLLDVL